MSGSHLSRGEEGSSTTEARDFQRSVLCDERRLEDSIGTYRRMAIRNMICFKTTSERFLTGRGQELNRKAYLLVFSFWFRIDELMLGHFEAYGAVQGVCRILPSELSDQGFMEGPSRVNETTRTGIGVTLNDFVAADTMVDM